ncbi:MAG: hypothetical protein JXB39_16805 [Deltaproteobacteria bacterium]|nr:hypothetical protein [Deltaproteobacteria bacterium]
MMHPFGLPCLAIVLWWAVGAATAGPIAVVPGRAVTAPPCAPDPRAACWDVAPRLVRFAPSGGEIRPAETADVRVAWSPAGLLVRAERLPSGAGIEVVVSTGRGSLLSHAAHAHAAEGLTTVPLAPPAAAGQVRDIQVSLVLLDPRGGPATVLPWAPTGDGDPARPARLVLASAPAPGRTVGVDLDPDGRIRISAAGAERVETWHERILLPGGDSGIPPPWSAAGPTPLAVIPPDASGWFTVLATWDDPEGRPAEVAAVRFHLTAAGAPAASSLDIHPSPRRLLLLPEAPFVPSEGARIHLGDPAFLPAARLLAEEIRRFTGRALALADRGRPRVGDVWIGPSTRSVPRHLETQGSLSDALRPGGFTVSASRAGAVIRADALAAAVHGSLALADAVGPDGRSPAFSAWDAPDLPWRFLYHRWGGPLDRERFRTFLRRVVARGRYNGLVLDLRSGYRWACHPELADAHALTGAELEAFLGEARDLGLVPIPGSDAPAHAEWILKAHPEWAEDGQSDLLCMRHPDARALLADVYDELIDRFHHPPFLHVGHDEVFWRTGQVPEDRRCPRCQSTPRWVLFGDDLAWTLEHLHARGVRPVVWADMLVEEWNGRYGDLHRALERVLPERLADLVVMTWARVGDPVAALAGGPWALVRGHTGYDDWKRTGLMAERTHLVGEALALFTPHPWSSLGREPGSWDLRFHWTNVLLAGTTGWRADLADQGSIDPTLGDLVQVPAFLPGYVHPDAWSGASRPLDLPLSAAPEGAPRLALPDEIRVVDVPFRTGTPCAVGPGAPLVLPVGRTIAGVSVLQAAVVPPGPGLVLASARKRDPGGAGPVVAEVRFRYASDREATRPMVLGLHTGPVEVPARGAALFEAAGAALVPSEEAARVDPEARDRVLVRFDAWNPDPSQVVAHVEIRVLEPGLLLLVAGAATLEAR